MELGPGQWLELGLGCGKSFERAVVRVRVKAWAVARIRDRAEASVSARIVERVIVKIMAKVKARAAVMLWPGQW